MIYVSLAENSGGSVVPLLLFLRWLCCARAGFEAGLSADSDKGGEVGPDEIHYIRSAFWRFRQGTVFQCETVVVFAAETAM